MIPYICVSVYTLCMAYFYKHSKSKYLRVYRKRIDISKLFFLFLLILPMVLVSGLRYGISIDYTKIYERGFDIIKYQGIGAWNFEIGFAWLVYLCSKINNNAWFMFLVVAAITIAVFCLSFDQSDNYIISIILFLGAGIYFDSFNGIRQYIVVAVFCYAFKYIRRREFPRYLIVMLLCSLFHTSALLTIPLYFLYKLRINKVHVIGVSAMLLALHTPIMNLMVTIMRLIPKYNLYLLRDTLQNQISFSLSGFITAIIALIPCILVEKKMKETDSGTFLLNMMYLGLIISVCSSFMPFAERMLYYTKAYILFAVPYAIVLSNGEKRLVGYGSIIMICTMNILGMLILDWYAVLPYVSIFSR